MRRGGAGRKFEEVGHDFGELGEVDWLAKVGACAGRKATFAILWHREAGDADDRDAGGLWRVCDLAGSLDAIEVRHLNVHQDEVGPVRGGQLDCLGTCVCDETPITDVLEEVSVEFEVYRMVICEEDEWGLGLGGGRGAGCRIRLAELGGCRGGGWARLSAH